MIDPAAPHPVIPSRPPLWRSDKIQDRHLERLAIVYVRQSTIQQTVRHQESTRLQYSLADRAADLGWPRDRTLVIDEDLGITGSSSEARLGFQRLVMEVGLDHVGLILGIEMSRLARSCKDWYQLLEVCALFGTLIADLDGIYDPSLYNDRLLLGLKGTMSEAELHIIKQRMHEGKLNKARRGELGMSLPIGYCKRPSGEVVLEPDEQAQGVVRLIFEQFERRGTLDGVLCYLVEHGVRIPVRAHSGPAKGELEWHRPNRPTLQNILHNPIYAGAYVYGRRPTDRRRKHAGRPGTGRLVAVPGTWAVFLRDRRPAYITWDQYEKNLAQLANNRNRAASRGVARRGAALLAGIVLCGRCGHRMTVHYDYAAGGVDHYTYICGRERSDYGAPRCQTFSGNALDRAVTDQTLRALEPAALEVSLQVAQDLETERARLEDQWTRQLERARYEAERAERQYHVVEPENRLVARTLEKAWEEKLASERQLQEEYARFRAQHPRTVTREQREQILELASDIPALWRAETTTNTQRSEILRQLIEQVIVAVQGTSEKMRVCIVWAGGHKIHLDVRRPVAKFDQLSYGRELLHRVKTLHDEGKTSVEIARTLNTEGWRPAKRAPVFSPQAVRNILSRNSLTTVRRPRTPDGKRLKRGEWWLPELARHLEMPEETLYVWMRRGWVHGKQLDGSQGRWVLWATRAEIVRLKRLRTAPRRKWAEDARLDSKPASPPPNWQIS